MSAGATQLISLVSPKARTQGNESETTCVWCSGFALFGVLWIFYASLVGLVRVLVLCVPSCAVSSSQALSY